MNNFEEIKDDLLLALADLYSNDFFDELTRIQKGEIAVLLFIYRNDGAVNPSVISDCLSISRARVTAIITSLAEKGMVEYQRGTSDRRKLICNITKVGEEHITSKIAELENRMIKVLTILGEEKSNMLVNIISEISNIISKERSKKENE